MSCVEGQFIHNFVFTIPILFGEIRGAFSTDSCEFMCSSLDTISVAGATNEKLEMGRDNSGVDQTTHVHGLWLTCRRHILTGETAHI